MKRPITIFYVYADTDETLRQQMEKHLVLLGGQGVIAGWEPILAGVPWVEKTERVFNEAELILLLVSADFLDSDVCYEQHMQRALERERQGEVKVLPILLRPVDWKSAPFAHLQVLPANEEPVTNWPNQDAAFASVTEGIRCALEGIPLPSIVEAKREATYVIDNHQVSYYGQTIGEHNVIHHHYPPAPLTPQTEQVVLGEASHISESQRVEKPSISSKIEEKALSSPLSEHATILWPRPISRVHLARLAFVGLLCLSLIGGTLFALRGSSFHTAVPSPPTSCFSDEFALNDALSGWQWIDIDRDSSGNIDQRGFSISVSRANKNLWTWNNNAPRLLQPVTGNFTVETQVEFDPQHQQYQGAGLLVYGDSGNYIRLERAFSEFEGIEFEKYEQSQLHTISSTAKLSQVSLRSVEVTNPHVQLELQREGDVFIAHWRPAGSNQSWRYVGETTLRLNKIVQVGLILVSDIKNKPTFQAVAHYNYFHIVCPSLAT